MKIYAQMTHSGTNVKAMLQLRLFLLFLFFWVKNRSFYLRRIYSDYITVEKENNIVETKVEFSEVMRLTVEIP